VGKSFAFTIMLKGSIGGSIAEEALACSGRLLEMAHPAKPARITGCNRSECGLAHLVSPSSAGSFFHVHLRTSSQALPTGRIAPALPGIQFLYVVDFNSIFGINRHAAG
jgi:hypothetical protein